MSSREIIVSISLGGNTTRVGKLWCHTRNNRESASFEYEQSWRSHEERFALEPALQLTMGAFHTRASKSLFGAIGDSAPERWGRLLLRRQAAATAKANNNTPATLSEADCTRMASAFSTDC